MLVGYTKNYEDWSNIWGHRQFLNDRGLGKYCKSMSTLNFTPYISQNHSSKESYRLCKKDYETEEEARVQQKGCRVIMNE
jgi:hypothetical protein